MSCSRTQHGDPSGAGIGFRKKKDCIIYAAKMKKALISCAAGLHVCFHICKKGFGFEGWIWVLIASVPDLCILFTFSYFPFWF